MHSVSLGNLHEFTDTSKKRGKTRIATLSTFKSWRINPRTLWHIQDGSSARSSSVVLVPWLADWIRHGSPPLLKWRSRPITGYIDVARLSQDIFSPCYACKFQECDAWTPPLSVNDKYLSEERYRFVH
jgi:hypothetical protein